MNKKHSNHYVRNCATLIQNTITQTCLMHWRIRANEMIQRIGGHGGL